MHRARKRAAFVAAALIAALAPRASAQEGTWALTNARIETVTRGVIERGTIVIRDGLIAAVGADVTAPADARVVDLSGRTVYPGLIDLTSSLGLATTPAGGQGGPGGGGQQAAAAAQPGARAFVGLEPERMVTDELRASATDIKAVRDLGITAVLSAPTRGAFRGRSALIPMRDSVTAREVIRSPVALHMGYQGTTGGFGANRYPATLLGVIAYERQAFYNAKRQLLLETRYRTSPRGMERPANDEALAALIPVVEGALPVFFAAGNENEIRRAVNIGREFNLALTVVGATEGFRALDALASTRRPVVVSVDYPRPTDVTGWAYRGAQRLPPGDSAAADSAGRRVLEGNAATLMNAGIRFALASGGRSTDFIANVRKAIAAGLPRDTALAALTIRAAEIAGVGEQLGSIETGKVANLVVTEGDLLGDSGKVRIVFVDGIRYPVDPPPAAANARGGRGRGGPGGPGGGAAEPAQVGGTWRISVTTPDGPQDGSVTFTQTGTGLTGTMTTSFGTAPITGAVTGTRISWSGNLTINGQPTPINYDGDVAGTRISGTVSAGQFGSFQFTGEKQP